MHAATAMGNIFFSRVNVFCLQYGSILEHSTIAPTVSNAHIVDCYMQTLNSANWHKNALVDAGSPPRWADENLDSKVAVGDSRMFFNYAGTRAMLTPSLRQFPVPRQRYGSFLDSCSVRSTQTKNLTLDVNGFFFLGIEYSSCSMVRTMCTYTTLWRA